jgi:hypothetical protein
MSSARDDGPDHQARPTAAALTRRGLLLGGIALVVSACVRGNGGERAGSGIGIWYVVQAGDSLTSLSRRTGLTTDVLATVNELESPVLKPGSRLWLPGLRTLAPEPVVSRPPESRPKPPDQAQAGDDHYEIVPRSAWTKEPVGPNIVAMGKVTRITLHHTDEHGGMDGRSDLDIVRMIENFHRGPQRRWAAIGYHYLIGKDGKIYEGRPVTFQGAHCGDNANNLGISVIGDFQHHLPNAKQLKALTAFLDDQRTRFDVSKSRVFGHRDIKATICPGEVLYAWLKAYKGRS